MCKFCEAMERHRRADFIPEIRRLDMNLKRQHSVAIVTRVYRNDHKGCQKIITVTDDCLGDGYDLNFCPECGRQLTKNSAIDSPPEKP